MPDLTTVNHGALVDALKQAGWRRIGRRDGVDVLLIGPCDNSSWLVPVDPEAPTYRMKIEGILSALHHEAEAGCVAQKVLDALQREAKP